MSDFIEQFIDSENVKTIPTYTIIMHAFKKCIKDYVQDMWAGNNLTDAELKNKINELYNYYIESTKE